MIRADLNQGGRRAARPAIAAIALAAGMLGVLLAAAPAGAATFASTDVPKPVGQEVIRPSTDTPKPIIDDDVITSQIEVGVGGFVAGVELFGIEISHTFPADLRVSLKSPQGTEVLLFDEKCLDEDWTQANTDFAIGGRFATEPISTDPTDPSCPPGPFSYLADGDLSRFQGERINGFWTLIVEDTFPLDSGTLHSWAIAILPESRSQLTVTGAAPSVRSVEVRNLRVQHTWAGDLQVFLRSPAGTMVELFSEVCGGIDGPPQDWTAGNTGFSFRSGDSSVQPISTGFPGHGCPPGTATYRPVGNLGSIRGQPANGNWELRVKDVFFFDEGELLAWSLGIADPPRATITSGPPESTRNRSASFSFSSDVPGSSFQCSLGGGDFTPCSSPHTVGNLSPDDHRFSVRAVDGVGNIGPAATYPWRVNPWQRVRYRRAAERFLPRGRSAVRVASLVIDRIRPRSAKVLVRCQGGRKRGCTFKQKRVRPQGKRRVARIDRLFRRPLKAGAKIVVIGQSRPRVDLVQIYKVAKGPRVRRTERCIAPGTRRMQPCRRVR